MSSQSDDDAVLPVTIGTAIWFVALGVAIVLRDPLRDNGSGWWITVAALGSVSGVCATAFVRARRARRRTRQE